MFTATYWLRHWRLLPFFLSFFLLYGLCALFLSHACFSDPSSLFWRPEQALQLSYSAVRREQARRFADEARVLDQVKWDNTTMPQLCLGIGSVSRHGFSYLQDTLGSLLEGLDELERRQIYLVVFLAHSNQSKHEDSSAVWLHNMVDSLPAYPDNPQLLELLETLEDDDSYPAHARKQKIDYSVLLDECAKVQPAYTATLEDDVIALDGWFHRLLDALRKAERQTQDMGRDHFLYLRIFNDSRLLGWNSEEWHYYVGASTLFMLVNIALILGSRRYSQRFRTLTPAIVVAFLCTVCVPMMILLFFAAGRDCVLPKREGVNLTQKYGCCAQGLVMPQQQIEENILPLYRDTTDSHAAVDTFLEDYANANDELRWAITPNLIQHVGRKSTHKADDDGSEGQITGSMPFSYNFETNNPEKLAQEHLIWIENLKRQQLKQLTISIS
ncbi:integral membrane protein [Xylaria castorea]|nr:integral membrane protein [Xylaria castorea]